MKYNSSDSSMKAMVENYQKPEKAYSQSYDQAPLNYIERQDKIQVREASKLKSESFKKGRYDK
jgi:hypothetical protein